MTLPPDTQLFSSVTTTPDSDGLYYCVDFLAKDFDDAMAICLRCNLSIKVNELGRKVAIVEKTPDGLLTSWERPFFTSVVVTVNGTDTRIDFDEVPIENGTATVALTPREAALLGLALRETGLAHGGGA